jgi:hypothetical protein
MLRKPQLPPHHRGLQERGEDLTNLHIVIHGADLPSDTDASSLSSLFEATLPVACGDIDSVVPPVATPGG